MKSVNGATPRKLVSIAGVCSFTILFVLALCWRNLFDVLIKTQLRLYPGSTLYKIWIDNNVPIYLEIYLFNLTNADEFGKNKTAVPDFEEIGPFLYEETREKVNVSWNDFDQTVTFNQTKKWRFVPELSRDFSVQVTNINPIAATIAYMSRLWESELQRKIANTLLKVHEPLFVTASAHEWIFKGIPDPFLDVMESLRKVTDIPIPYNKFGWFFERNQSSTFDGAFTIKTGASKIDDLGLLVGWNYRNQTDHYEDSCALVQGYTGEIMPPLKASQSTLTVFASDICSYINLKYEDSVRFDGIEAYDYVGDESVFDNGTSYPENLCFYLGESCPSGLRNVSSCRFGSPAFISFPHFYLADTHYRENLTGMNPDESKHKFSLKIEPKLGVPLAVDASFQINFLVEPYDWCDDFRDIRKMYIPMLWFKQTVKMPSEYSNVLKFVFFMQNNAGYIFFAYSFVVLFCLLTFLYSRVSPR